MKTLLFPVLSMFFALSLMASPKVGGEATLVYGFHHVKVDYWSPEVRPDTIYGHAFHPDDIDYPVAMTISGTDAEHSRAFYGVNFDKELVSVSCDDAEKLCEAVTVVPSELDTTEESRTHTSLRYERRADGGIRFTGKIGADHVELLYSPTEIRKTFINPSDRFLTSNNFLLKGNGNGAYTSVRLPETDEADVHEISFQANPKFRTALDKFPQLIITLFLLNPIN